MRAFLCVTLLAATPVLATPYDGVFRPNYSWAEGWDCQSIGMDGGAVAIEGDQFMGVENSCTLTDPVEVRGMEATIYDAECSGEGTTTTERLILMQSGDASVVLVIRNGWASEWARCY